MAGDKKRDKLKEFGKRISFFGKKSDTQEPPIVPGPVGPARGTEPKKKNVFSSVRSRFTKKGELANPPDHPDDTNPPNGPGGESSTTRGSGGNTATKPPESSSSHSVRGTADEVDEDADPYPKKKVKTWLEDSKVDSNSPDVTDPDSRRSGDGSVSAGISSDLATTPTSVKFPETDIKGKGKAVDGGGHDHEGEHKQSHEGHGDNEDTPKDSHAHGQRRSNLLSSGDDNTHKRRGIVFNNRDDDDSESRDEEVPIVLLTQAQDLGTELSPPPQVKQAGGSKPETPDPKLRGGGDFSPTQPARTPPPKGRRPAHHSKFKPRLARLSQEKSEEMPTVKDRTACLGSYKHGYVRSIRSFGSDDGCPLTYGEICCLAESAVTEGKHARKSAEGPDTAWGVDAAAAILGQEGSRKVDNGD